MGEVGGKQIERGKTPPSHALALPSHRAGTFYFLLSPGTQLDLCGSARRRVESAKAGFLSSPKRGLWQTSAARHRQSEGQQTNTKHQHKKRSESPYRPSS